eukprot:7468706-Pyramimonas_sp.AAC.1
MAPPRLLVPPNRGDAPASASSSEETRGRLHLPPPRRRVGSSSPRLSCRRTRPCQASARGTVAAA